MSRESIAEGRGHRQGTLLVIPGGSGRRRTIVRWVKRLVRLICAWRIACRVIRVRARASWEGKNFGPRHDFSEVFRLV